MFIAIPCRLILNFTGNSLRRSAFFLLLLWMLAQSPALAWSEDPFRSSPQKQDLYDITVLDSGSRVEREISGGQVHSYRITLLAGQFASIAVQQRGVDVAEEVFAPDGKLIAGFDFEARLDEAERTEFVSETAGVYRLDVKAIFRGAAGRYEVRVKEIRAATESDRSLHEAQRLSTESSKLRVSGKFDEALTLAARALEVGEKAAAEPSYIAFLLNELGLLQTDKGEYAKAEASYQRAHAINEKTLGPEHPQTALSLKGLATVYTYKDDFGKARPLFQQAVEITEKSVGAEHPKVAAGLSNRGTFHSKVGDLMQAERDLQRALAIAEKTLDPDDLLTSQVLNNLGHLYILKKDYDRADTSLQRALAIKEKLLGPDHSQLAYPLLNLGRIARERKDYDRSLEMYRRALAIQEKALGPEHLEVAVLLNNIANVYKSKGDYAKPFELYQRALNVAEKSAGPYHGFTMVVLGNLARTYAARGDITNALKFQARVDDRLETALGLNLAIGSERQKLAYFDSLAERTDRTISLHAHLAPTVPAASALAALVLLQRKGRILDAMSESLTSLRQRFNPEDQKLLDQLNETTAKLAKLALNGPQEMTAHEYHKQLSELEEKKEKLEAQVSHRSAEFRAQSQPVTLAAVQAKIPANAALIEFAIYRPFDPRVELNSEAYGKPRYIAYILRGQGDVQWRDLGDAQVLDADVGKLRQALRDPQRGDVRDLARLVDEKVMQPVRGLLGGAKHLLISPDGELNLIPFAALVDEEGRYAVGRYSFTYLTSGRDLLRMQVARESKTRPLVIANPSFGEPASELLATNIAANVATARNRRRSVTTGRDITEVYFASLSGTADEAEKIRKLFRQSDMLSGAQATESALKEVTAPQFLHVATHGFFLSEPGVARSQMASPVGAAVATNSPAQATMRSINASAKIANPLLRSGLALTGANSRSGGSDDGILTALEASGLNLWGTKLVVLSACDTGVGEVRNGEGVYGLRRAFVLAGADSLVMSLWPVSDYPTRRLMTEYYQNLKLGLGRGEALRQAQLRLLDDKLHPFYWANFIQSGDWTGIDEK
ncbi:MAG TPA: CHAT domain-containing tetratricopeptide repeat protein [Pyrinomonadaceae bacterium]|nr:CHAT domain-containing tetratricopeptide repeat protein [Pyrinomonadaceae bacterium]